MRKITILLMGVLMTTGVIASEYEYVPLVREGVVWEYVGYNSKHGIHPDVAHIYALEFNGVCEKGHKLYRTDYNADGSANEPYLVAYVNEEDKVVTVSFDENMPFTNNYEYIMIFGKIYDFNNDELYFLPNEAVYFSAQLNIYNLSSESFTVEVGNTIRNGYYINYDKDDYVDVKIIEGIGADCKYGDLLVPFRDFPTAIDGVSMAGLTAVYENGELVYQGCLYDEAQELKHKKEDVDGDGYVTVADVTALYDYLLNNDDTYINSLDVNGDGEVTSSDITAIYNQLLGE